MTISDEWLVAVFKCPAETAKHVVVEVYRFTENLKGVRSLHFLVRDRVENEVVFSLRVMVEHRFRVAIKTKMAHELSSLLSEGKFAIDPTAENSLEQYAAWMPNRRIEDFGQEKFVQFIDLLKNLSAIVVKLIENGYFASYERVELAHIVSWILGCTEYGLLSSSGFEVGFYDRFEDKYCSYLRQDFPKTNSQKKPGVMP